MKSQNAGNFRPSASLPSFGPLPALVLINGKWDTCFPLDYLWPCCGSERRTEIIISISYADWGGQRLLTMLFMPLKIIPPHFNLRVVIIIRGFIALSLSPLFETQKAQDGIVHHLESRSFWDPDAKAGWKRQPKISVLQVLFGREQKETAEDPLIFLLLILIYIVRLERTSQCKSDTYWLSCTTSLFVQSIFPIVPSHTM